MVKLFEGVKNSLDKLDSRTWYSVSTLRSRGLYSDSLLSNGSTFVRKGKNGDEVLGSSVINYFRIFLGESVPLIHNLETPKPQTNTQLVRKYTMNDLLRETGLDYVQLQQRVHELGVPFEIVHSSVDVREDDSRVSFKLSPEDIRELRRPYGGYNIGKYPITDKDKLSEKRDWFVDFIRETPLLSPEEELALSFQKESDIMARDRLIVSNLRAALWMGSRYYNRVQPVLRFGLGIEDVVQDAVMGLVHGIDLYNPNSEKSKISENPDARIRILTYAGWWMRQNMMLRIKNIADLIRVPVYVHEARSKIHSFCYKFLATHGFAPSEDEICKATGMTRRRVHSIMVRNAHQVYSLDAWMSSDPQKDGYTLEETIPDRLAVSPDKLVADSSDSERLLKFLDILDLDQREIIQARYGLNGAEPLSLEETSVKFSKKRITVRKIEAGALRKLRSYAQKKGFENN